MSLPSQILDALKTYDINKGFWRRLFRRDQAAIRALRGLNETEQANVLKLYCCFIENKPKETQESYKVYRTLLDYLTSLDCSGIPDTLNQLYSNQLLTRINVEKLNPLIGDHFRKFSPLLDRLNNKHLLTQLSFDNITEHFEATEEDISEILSSLLTSVDKLHEGNSLTKENLECILTKPLQMANIASILVILEQNHILTADNRIQLCDKKNELLLRSDAYRVIWHPLEAYLSALVSTHKRQRIFDQVISLTQKEQEIEGIENYVSGLIAEASKPMRRNTFEKFSTAPPERIKSRSIISGLNLILDRSGTL